MFKPLLLVVWRYCVIALFTLLSVPLAEANMAKAATDESSHPFDVWEFRIEGNTILDNQVIEKTVYQFLGNNKNIATVEEARGALEKAYHDAGYQAALVDIP